MPEEGGRGATALIGKLDEFDAANESLSDYVERAQLFFEANDIPANKRVAGFLSAVGGKTYALIRNLVAPTPPRDKSFDELVTVLRTHLEPKPLVIAERFAFHRRQQAKGETVAEYVAELRKLTKHCEFGAYLEEALRDRFVCGLRSEPIQKRLLAEADLTFQRAVQQAQGMEMAAAQARQLQSPSSDGQQGQQPQVVGHLGNNRAVPTVSDVGGLTTLQPSVHSRPLSATTVASLDISRLFADSRKRQKPISREAVVMLSRLSLRKRTPGTY